jgi:hypothetical protein
MAICLAVKREAYEAIIRKLSDIMFDASSIYQCSKLEGKLCRQVIQNAMSRGHGTKLFLGERTAQACASSG